MRRYIAHGGLAEDFLQALMSVTATANRNNLTNNCTKHNLSASKLLRTIVHAPFRFQDILTVLSDLPPQVLLHPYVTPSKPVSTPFTSLMNTFGNIKIESALGYCFTPICSPPNTLYPHFTCKRLFKIPDVCSNLSTVRRQLQPTCGVDIQCDSRRRQHHASHEGNFDHL